MSRLTVAVVENMDIKQICELDYKSVAHSEDVQRAVLAKFMREDCRYGPFLNIKFSKRYERAIEYDLNPPMVVGDILKHKPHLDMTPSETSVGVSVYAPGPAQFNTK
jgi:hypothetical protein